MSHVRVKAHWPILYATGLGSVWCLLTPLLRLFIMCSQNWECTRNQKKANQLYLNLFLNIFVIEGCHIQPATVVANTDCEKYDVVCMGYPGLTPEQFLLRVRGTNWAVAKNDAEIIQMGECFIARSRQYQETCKQYNIKFIDTSDGILTALGDYMK